MPSAVEDEPPVRTAFRTGFYKNWRISTIPRTRDAAGLPRDDFTAERAMSQEVKSSIVFAHGLWADGSCFSKVIPVLQADGHGVIAAQNSLDTSVIFDAGHFVWEDGTGECDGEATHLQ
jgi:hypothetical protein